MDSGHRLTGTFRFLHCSTKASVTIFRRCTSRLAYLINRCDEYRPFYARYSNSIVTKTRQNWRENGIGFHLGYVT